MANNKRKVTTTFIMDAKYYAQVQKLSAERAAALFNAILSYNLTGEVPDFGDDLALEMLFDVMRTDFDANNEKYEQKMEETAAARSAAGAKGAEKRWGKSNNDSKNSKDSKDSKNSKDNKNGYDMTCSDMRCNDITCDDTMSSSSDDYEDIDNSARGRCHREDAEAIVPFGKDMIPSTQEEIRKVEDLAERLCMEYKQKPPNKTDVQKVFDHVHVRTELPNGEAVATFDQQKAALLEYAWEQAAAAEKVSWRYIDGIYRNWNDNGIDSLQKLEEHEFKRQHGMSQEMFMQKFYGG